MAIALGADMKLNRRNFVVGAGSTVAVAGLSSTAGADDSIPVEIVNVYPVEDVVILENTGDETVDLSGYQMDWGIDVDEDQTDPIPDGTTIGAGGQLSVWTGFESERVDSIEADVVVGDHDWGRINADEPNTLGLRTPGGEIVAETDDTVADDPAYDANEYDEEPEDDVDEEPVRQDVEFEYRYTYEGGDDSELDDRLELSSAEFYYEESDEFQDSCYIDFDLENLTDTEEMTVYLAGSVTSEDGETEYSYEDIVVPEPGETLSAGLRFPECIEADGGEGHVHASVTRIEEVEEADDEDEKEPEDERLDIKFEYQYDLEQWDDKYLEQRLELRNGEAYIREMPNRDYNYCYITGEVENLTDDEDIHYYISGRLGDRPTYESSTSIEAGETSELHLEVIECPNDFDPDHASIRAWAPYVGEPHEEPEDYEPEDDEDEDADADEETPEDEHEEEDDVDEDPDEEETDDTDEEPEKADLDIDVSVSAPSDRDGDAKFRVTVRNHGGESANPTLCLDVGGVTRSGTIQVGAGGCQTKRFSVSHSELSAGTHSWKVWTTTEDEKTTGTLTIC
ncbi:lamin tail domain-containing protein [Natronococcus occultus]|uniref:LTD domain-containing protein n=1 Tax=Natronococcus occultus SP4 TaxID=694430 RepID=L0K0T0_9EURY|nr:lamin tail domain-containing protein [Natronococcus occultus]AGB37728.1 hypothetical protein Natoc_1938 [Natronococcus occultus SP4]